MDKKNACFWYGGIRWGSRQRKRGESFILESSPQNTAHQQKNSNSELNTTNYNDQWLWPCLSCLHRVQCMSRIVTTWILILWNVTPDILGYLSSLIKHCINFGNAYWMWVNMDKINVCSYIFDNINTWHTQYLKII